MVKNLAQNSKKESVLGEDFLTSPPKKSITRKMQRLTDGTESANFKISDQTESEDSGDNLSLGQDEIVIKNPAMSLSKNLNEITPVDKKNRLDTYQNGCISLDKYVYGASANVTPPLQKTTLGSLLQRTNRSISAANNIRADALSRRH